MKILDAEAENLDHQQTAERIVKEDPKLAVFMIYGQQPSASTMHAWWKKNLQEIK